MGSALITVLPLDVHVKVLATTAQEFKPFDAREAVAVEGEQSEAQLDYDVLHGEVTGEEDDMLGGSLLNELVLLVHFFLLNLP